MGKLYITVTGVNHYYGSQFIEKGMKVRLEKEPDNEYDKEAIAELIETGETAKKIYIGSLRRFGRNHGLAIYRRMKGSGSIEKLLS